MSWIETAGTVVASVLASGGAVAIVQAVASRRKVKVDAADQLSDAALDQLRAVRTDAMEQIALARRDVEDARRSAQQAWAEAADARREAMAATAQLRRLHSEILSPVATVDHLRTLVSVGGQNGYYGRPNPGPAGW